MRAVRLVVLTSALVLLAGLLVPVPRAYAATTTDSLLLLMDLSGSMREQDKSRRIKIEGAKVGVIGLLDSLPSQARVGLMTYPGDGGCGAPKTVRAINPLSQGNLGAQVSGLPSPSGNTPTADALSAAAETVRQDGGRATIVLVSDGLANCNKPPCPVAKAIAASGIPITVNTIGFDIDLAGSSELDCIAKATGGRHVTVDQGDDLGEEIRKQMTPTLEIWANFPSGTIPVSSTGAIVKARVTNGSGVTATNVGVSLTPTGTGSYLPVRRPVIALGNLAGGESREVSWTVPVTPQLSGKKASLRITASGANAPLVASEGLLTFGDGPLVSAGSQFANVNRVAVLGDSFSAGDGAFKKLDEYTDTRCRTSGQTYADALFPGKVDNFACTGAVTADVTSSSQHAGVRPQVQQLRAELKKGSRYDLVFLTIGGNDVGFGDIAKFCVISQLIAGVGNTIYNVCSIDPAAWLLYEKQIDLIAAQDPLLQDVYQEVARSFGERGLDVPPIVVSPYPQMFPSDPALRASCGLVELGVDRKRIAQFGTFQRVLNKQIEHSVNHTRDEFGIPVYFADSVEYAFQPDHTMCGRDPFVAMPTHLNSVVNSEWNTPFHPTKEGHEAWALSLARWADRPGLELQRGTRSQSSPLPWIFELAPRAAISGDAAFNVSPASFGELTVTGLAPGSPVIALVRSSPYALGYVTADDQGVAELAVDLGRSGVPPGLHTLELTVVEPNGTVTTRETPLYVTRSIPYWWWVPLALGLVGVVTGLILRRVRSRAG